MWYGDGQWSHIHQISAGNECGYIVHIHLYMSYVYCGVGSVLDLPKAAASERSIHSYMDP